MTSYDGPERVEPSDNSVVEVREESFHGHFTIYLDIRTIEDEHGIVSNIEIDEIESGGVFNNMAQTLTGSGVKHPIARFEIGLVPIDGDDEDTNEC